MFQNSMKQRMNWEDFYGPNLGYALVQTFPVVIQQLL